jgi:hypothetical protein
MTLSTGQESKQFYNLTDNNMKRKVGDNVVVKTKYFDPFDGSEGVIVDIDDCYQKITVKIDHVDSLQVFDKSELKARK